MVSKPIYKPQKVYQSIGKVEKLKKIQLRKLNLSYESPVYFKRELGIVRYGKLEQFPEEIYTNFYLKFWNFNPKILQLRVSKICSQILRFLINLAFLS